MPSYDPAHAPDPTTWLALDDGVKQAIVEDYHRRAKVRLPRAPLHAIMHVVIENQIALGDECPTRETADRLMREGLDRHDAIHAIGSVLAGHLSGLMREPPTTGDPNDAYFGELKRLTAESWLALGDT
jgi:hypothetical protein